MKTRLAVAVLLCLAAFALHQANAREAKRVAACDELRRRAAILPSASASDHELSEWVIADTISKAEVCK